MRYSMYAGSIYRMQPAEHRSVIHVVSVDHCVFIRKVDTVEIFV